MFHIDGVCMLVTCTPVRGLVNQLKLLSKMMTATLCALWGSLRSVLVATKLDQTVGLRFGFNVLPMGHGSKKILIRPNVYQGLS